MSDKSSSPINLINHPHQKEKENECLKLYSRVTPDEKISKIKVDKIIDECKDYGSELICFICKTLIFDAIICDECQNIFCTQCIAKWSLVNPETCPLRCKLKARELSNVIKNFLSKIKLRCKYDVNGCEEILNYNEYFTHLTDFCKFVLYKCSSEGCSYTKTEGDMKDHVTKCEKTLLCCEFCNNSIIRVNMPTHEKECMERLFICQLCKLEVKIKDYKNHETECIYLKTICTKCKPAMFKNFLFYESNKNDSLLIHNENKHKIIEEKNIKIIELENRIKEQENKLKALDKMNIDLKLKLENSILESLNYKNNDQKNDIKDLKLIKNIMDIKGTKDKTKEETDLPKIKQIIKDILDKENGVGKSQFTHKNMFIGIEKLKLKGINCVEMRDPCKPLTGLIPCVLNSNINDLMIYDYSMFAWKNNIKNTKFEDKIFYWKNKKYAEYWGPSPLNESSFNHYNMPDKSIEIFVINDISKDFCKTIGIENLPHQCGRCNAILHSFSSFMNHLKDMDFVPKKSLINGSPYRYWLFWHNENDFANFWYSDNENSCSDN